MKKLKLDKNFKPCLTDEDDEIYPNGFFEFNITKMIEFISQNKDQFIVENIVIEKYRKFVSENLNEETIFLLLHFPKESTAYPNSSSAFL